MRTKVNSLSELISHLCEKYGSSEYCCGGIIEFHDYDCPVNGIYHMPSIHDLCIVSDECPGYMFLITPPFKCDWRDYDGIHFSGEMALNLVNKQVVQLFIYRGAFHFDQTLCVTLPAKYADYIADLLWYL